MKTQTIKLKILCLLLCIATLCALLCACTGNGNTNSPNGTPSGTPSDAPSGSNPEQGDTPSGDHSGDTPENPTTTAPLLGVWWWSDKLGDEYLQFAKEQGVTEIYYCSGKFNDGTETFIHKANAQNIDVYWLAGEYEWVEHPDWLTTQMQRYQAFQSQRTHVFKGIHFDIEPQQHPDWHTRRMKLLAGFIDLARNLAQTYPDIWIEYDIQFSWEDEYTLDGVTKPVFAHVMDCASRVTLMSYRDTAEKIYSVSKSEIEYAKSQGKLLNLGVNTKSSEGNQVSFQEEGTTVMYSEIARLREMIPQNFGVVIHQIAHWYNLHQKEKSMKISVGDKTLTVKLEENSSALALLEKLQNGPITVTVHDYGNFEKVGSLGFSLPRNDTTITTKPGDVILYLGSEITFYYDKNTWDFTKLGSVPNATKQSMLEFFGDGEVTVTLSL